MSTFSSELQQKLTCDPVIIKSDPVENSKIVPLSVKRPLQIPLSVPPCIYERPSKLNLSERIYSFTPRSIFFVGVVQASSIKNCPIV